VGSHNIEVIAQLNCFAELLGRVGQQPARHGAGRRNENQWD